MCNKLTQRGMLALLVALAVVTTPSRAAKMDVLQTPMRVKYGYAKLDCSSNMACIVTINVPDGLGEGEVFVVEGKLTQRAAFKVLVK